MYQFIVIACLAITAVAHPNIMHKHLHQRAPSASVGVAMTGTGSAYSTSAGPYSNTTTVTVSVDPVAATSAASVEASAASDACSAGSASTTTITSTEVVTVTVGASSAAADTSSVVSTSATSTDSSTADVEDAFYAESSSSAVDAGTSSASTTMASSTTAAAASTTASSSSNSSSSSSSKRGLAYTDASLTEYFEGEDVSWAYDWSAYQDGSILSGLEFVPQFWGPTAISKADWFAAANEYLTNGTTHLLSMNEIDEVGQADLSASSAATYHKEYMNPFASNASIGSPSVTNGEAPMGLTYLQSFLDACDGDCTIDFLQIHWYAGYYDGVVDYFKTYVKNATTLASDNGISKIWITEFALDDASDSESEEFLEAVVPWLDEQSAVERYAYYMVSDGSLLSGDSISSIGEAYLS